MRQWRGTKHLNLNENKTIKCRLVQWLHTLAVIVLGNFTRFRWQCFFTGLFYFIALYQTDLPFIVPIFTRKVKTVKTTFKYRFDILLSPSPFRYADRMILAQSEKMRNDSRPRLGVLQKETCLSNQMRLEDIIALQPSLTSCTLILFISFYVCYYNHTYCWTYSPMKTVLPNFHRNILMKDVFLQYSVAQNSY